jgi:hypothetical protein
MPKIYFIARHRRKRTEYWSRDTARTFWHGIQDERWLRIFDSADEATKGLESLRPNYIAGFHYYIGSTMWTPRQVTVNKNPPLEGIPCKKDGY